MLMNIALGVGYKPPHGEAWTPAMLMPGYSAPSALSDYNWQAEKAKFGMIGKPPDRAKRQKAVQAQSSTRSRFKLAKEAQERGASKDEIRRIMEA